MVLCLVKEDAVNAWRKLIGPKEREKIKDAVGSYEFINFSNNLYPNIRF